MATEETPNEEQDEEIPVEIRPADFVAGGRQLDTISVNINFGIIEQFSEGLYSSPNKTFEELVTNSYDAGATRVWVRVPEKLDDPDAILAVIDNRPQRAQASSAAAALTASQTQARQERDPETGLVARYIFRPPFEVTRRVTVRDSETISVGDVQINP